MPEYLTLMPDDLLLYLLGLLAFLIPLLVKLPLCALTKGIARRAGLLFPLLWLAAALWALSVDESHSFIRLGPSIAKWLAVRGILALMGYGSAWLLFHLFQRKRK